MINYTWLQACAHKHSCVSEYLRRKPARQVVVNHTALPMQNRVLFFFQQFLLAASLLPAKLTSGEVKLRDVPGSVIGCVLRRCGGSRHKGFGVSPRDLGIFLNQPCSVLTGIIPELEWVLHVQSFEQSLGIRMWISVRTCDTCCSGRLVVYSQIKLKKKSKTKRLRH